MVPPLHLILHCFQSLNTSSILAKREPKRVNLRDTNNIRWVLCVFLLWNRLCLDCCLKIIAYMNFYNKINGNITNKKRKKNSCTWSESHGVVVIVDIVVVVLLLFHHFISFTLPVLCACVYVFVQLIVDTLDCEMCIFGGIEIGGTNWNCYATL